MNGQIPNMKILILHNLMKSVFRKILHILHSADRIFGTVRRNVPEKICTCSVSGSGCIPAPDYNKLRSIGCRINNNAEGLQLNLIRSLAIILFAGIRERIADNETPKAFDGFPMALITAGLMSIAFLGFSGLIKL